MKRYEWLENLFAVSNFLCFVLALYGLLQIDDRVSFWIAFLLLSATVVPILFALPLLVKEFNLSISATEGTNIILREMKKEYGIQFYICDALNFIGMIVVCCYMIYFNHGLRWVGVSLMTSHIAICSMRLLKNRRENHAFEKGTQFSDD